MQPHPSEQRRVAELHPTVIRQEEQAPAPVPHRNVPGVVTGVDQPALLPRLRPVALHPPVAPGRPGPAQRDDVAQAVGVLPARTAHATGLAVLARRPPGLQAGAAAATLPAVAEVDRLPGRGLHRRNSSSVAGVRISRMRRAGFRWGPASATCAPRTNDSIFTYSSSSSGRSPTLTRPSR